MSEAAFEHLINLNGHRTAARDARIRFEDEGHRYFLDGQLCRRADGWLSTTTFIHDFWEPFDADAIIFKMMKKERMQSGAFAGMSMTDINEAVTRLIANGERFTVNEKYVGMSAQEVKDAWNLNGEESCRLGSLMHLNCERYYNQVPIEPEHLEGVEREYELFLEFAQDHEHLEPFRTELMIFDLDLKITGSIDMLFIDPADGQLVMMDWKRLNKPMERTTQFNKYSTHPLLRHLPDTNLWHYAMQQNIYKYLLQKNYGFTVKEMYLVAMHHTMDRYAKHEVPDLQREIGLLFEERLRRLNGVPDPEPEPQDEVEALDLSQCIL